MKTNKLPLVAIGVFAGIVMIVIIAAAIFIQRNEAAKSAEERFAGTSKTDPVSGVPVTESDRQHDSNGIEVTFLGFGKLVERGLTMQQMTDVQFKFNELSKQLPKPIKIVSLYKDSITRILPVQSGNDYQEVHFKVQADQKTDYDVVIKYENISTVDMTVTDPDGKAYEL